MITFPNAKINLGLNIIEKRPDGYHNLETIFYPINLQDALEVTRSTNSDKEYNLHVSGSALDGEPEDNLVVKAYKLLKEDFPQMAAIEIHMYKHIPAGAGLGGGSSGRIRGTPRCRLCIFHSKQTGICNRHREYLRTGRFVFERISHCIGQTGYFCFYP